MTFLLDSNVCVEYLRGRNRLVLSRLASVPPHRVRLCSVVKAELYIGAYRSADTAGSIARIDAFSLPYYSLEFDDTSARIQGEIRHHLEQQGLPIGPYDLQIAAIALANGCTLVTHNTREFRRVPQLAVEDWELP